MNNQDIVFVPFNERKIVNKTNNNHSHKKNNDKLISTILTISMIIIVILLFLVSTLRNMEDVNNNKTNDIIKVIFKK